MTRYRLNNIKLPLEAGAEEFPGSEKFAGRAAQGQSVLGVCGGV